MHEKRTESKTHWSGWAVRYGVAFSFLVVALLIRQLLRPALHDSVPYMTLYLAVLGSVYYAGLGPAVFCALLGGAATVYFFVSPQLSFAMSHASHLLWLVFYFLTAGSIITAMESRARAEGRARRNARLAEQHLREVEEQSARRELAERENENLRRWATQTLASIGDAVMTTDSEGRITFLNEIAVQLTGWTLEQAKGQPIERVFDIKNEKTGELIESPVGRVLREGIVIGLANHTVLTTKSGSVIPIDDSGAPIRDEENRIQGAVLVFRDFTERRRAEESAAQLAAIVESSQDAIISKTLKGDILTWNGGAERVFGYSAAEAVGCPMSLLVPSDREVEEVAILESIREGRRLESFETVRIRKDGQPVSVSLSISPIYDSEGEIAAVSHIARDITAQKEFESQLLQAQKLESLGLLAGGIAHDFNNLLTGVIGSCSFALEFLEKNSPAIEAVNQALRAGEQAAHLTRQMLAYSGKGKFVVERVNASAVIEELAKLLGASIPRSVELRFDLEKDLPAIEVDVAQFQQLVMNLIINGAEAIGEEPGSVSVATAAVRMDENEIFSHVAFQDLKPGDYVRVRVSDTGCGMDAGTVDRIFDPFFTTKFTGRGLGLSAALGIVRSHGGAIHIDTEPGHGTTFTVLIPVAGANERKIEKVEPALETDCSGTVLVIDDEEIVRQTAKMALEKAGYRVIVAENGRAGVEQFRRWSGCLTAVLLDLTMPVMSGNETLERIRAIRPDVPVIMSSGYNEAEVHRRCNGMRIAGFLQKPFTAPVLAAKVRAAAASS